MREIMPPIETPSPAPPPSGDLALYVHWPFCVSKCPYCDFNSHVREGVDQAAWRAALLTDLTLDPPQSTGDLAGPPGLDEDWLTLSTVHSAKGGEWDVVHVIHLADGCFPSDMATGSVEELEEERACLTRMGMMNAAIRTYGTALLEVPTVTLELRVGPGQHRARPGRKTRRRP